MGNQRLAALLETTWQQQIDDGFLLGDPGAPVETRYAEDPVSGIRFRFRWLPHRAIRGVAAELARWGIYDFACEERDLPADERNPQGRPCFLCAGVIRSCFPAEVLVPIEAGGRSWLAGANFAWLAANHFTVASSRHEDQAYDRSVLDAMLGIHHDTAGAFRIIYNGAGAGASIHWHLHLQMTTDPFPVESLPPGGEDRYPLPLARFGSPASADDFIGDWHAGDPAHEINLMVGGPPGHPTTHVFLRDGRRLSSPDLGPMASFEACGDLVFDAPGQRDAFERADLAMALEAFAGIRPPDAPIAGRLRSRP